MKSIKTNNKHEKKSTSNNRRIFARIPIKLPLRFLEEGKTKKTQAQIINLSGNGIGFVSKRQLSPNTPVEIWVNIPSRNEPVYIAGKIVWSQNLVVHHQEWRSGVLLNNANPILLGQIYYKHTNVLDSSL